MTAPMISEQWARFVLPIVRKEWFQAMTSVASPLMSLMGIQSSKFSVEYSQGVGGFGLIPEYNSATAEGEASAVAYDSFSPLYEKTFTFREFAKAVAIERKLLDDNQTGLIKRRAQGLGNSFGTTRAYHASSILNNAFSSDYVGADAVCLCSASHPTNINDSTAVSNVGDDALSYATLVDTMIAGSNLKDDRGLPMPAIYDILYVPTALQAKAFEIVKAVGKPGTADNDANFLASRGLRVIVDPYLTDANNWFMIDSAKSQMHLLWINRIMPELITDPSSNFNLVARFLGYMRYDYGWDDYRFIYGHEVT